ncbi:Transcriptional activator flo8 [Saitoella coloradoensis]
MNGTAGSTAQSPRAAPPLTSSSSNASNSNQNQQQMQSNEMLQVYIYDYLLKQGLPDSARAFLNEVDYPVTGSGTQGSSSQGSGSRDGHGGQREDQTLESSIPSDMEQNPRKRPAPNDDADTGADQERRKIGKHEDLLPAAVPIDAPDGFLLEWWTIFWDIFTARSGKGGSVSASAYIAHQQRMRQEAQQRGMNIMGQQHPGFAGVPGQPMNGQQFGPNMRVVNGMPTVVGGLEPNMTPQQQQREMLMRQAMLNNQRKGNTIFPQNAQTQQQLHMLRQAQIQQVQQQQQQQQQQAQQVQAQQQQQQQGQFSEEAQEGRMGSPAGAQATSPTKRQRLSPEGQQVQLPTQPGQPQQPMQGMPQNPQQVAQARQQAMQQQQMMLNVGMNSAALTPQQLMAFQQQTNNPLLQKQNPQMNIASYTQSLMSQQQRALNAAKGGPMPGQMNQMGGNGMPSQDPSGQLNLEGMQPHVQQQFMRQLAHQQNQAGANGNMALAEYQSQLMVLEKQNKERLLAARQEQDRGGSSEAPGQSFQDMSPQTTRTGQVQPSPQPGSLALEKRGTPKMGHIANPNSPVPDPQGPPRGPSPATFNGQEVDPRQMMMYQQIKQQQSMNDNLPQGMMMGPNGQIMRTPSMAGAGGQPGYMPNGAMQHMGMMNGGNQQEQMMRLRQQNPALWHQQQQQLAQQMQLQQMRAQQMAAQQQQGQGQVVPQGPHGPQQQPMNPSQQMPPPQAPPQQPQQRNPQNEAPSPSLSNAQPPTPTQSHKPAPKGKKEPKEPKPKKGGGKKNAPAAPTPATPQATSEPPTPTTPITPQHPQSFSSNPMMGGNPMQAPTSNPSNPPQLQQQTSQPDPAPFTAIDTGADSSTLFGEFGMGDTDPNMDAFDFDAFLTTTADDGAGGGFDTSFGFTFGDGVEAGADA